MGTEAFGTLFILVIAALLIWGLWTLLVFLWGWVITHLGLLAFIAVMLLLIGFFHWEHTEA